MVYYAQAMVCMKLQEANYEARNNNLRFFGEWLNACSVMYGVLTPATIQWAHEYMELK